MGTCPLALRLVATNIEYSLNSNIVCLSRLVLLGCVKPYVSAVGTVLPPLMPCHC